MKKIIIVTASLFSIVGNCFAQSADSNDVEYKGIHFEYGLNWKQILEKAKLENKYIFVDCFTTWCGPCKGMDTKVYPDERVGNVLNNRFISVRVQMDTSKLDEDKIKMWYAKAKEIKEEYKVTAFPTYLFFSPDGSVVHRDIGYKSPESFTNIASYALNPKKQYYTLLSEFQKGNMLDSSTMAYLARRTKDFGGLELAEQIANSYINTLKEEQLFTSTNIWLMYDFTSKSSERGFLIFRNNAEKIFSIEKRMDPKYSQAMLEKIIYNEEIRPYVKSDNGKPDWQGIERRLQKYDSLGIKTMNYYRPTLIFRSEVEPKLNNGLTWDTIFTFIQSLRMKDTEEPLIRKVLNYYENKIQSGINNNCADFIDGVSYYFEAFPSKVDDVTLNGVAWTIFKVSTNEEELKVALKWSKRAIDLANPNLQIFAEENDTFANLLYKLGKRDEAIIWEQKALSIYPSKSSINDSLQKMRKGDPTWR